MGTSSSNGRHTDAMAADLFISYAWTPGQHRQWVRLLAAYLKHLGYDVLIDSDVKYGDSLTGFMRRVMEAEHVLMIADDNYVDRAEDRKSTRLNSSHVSNSYAV